MKTFYFLVTALFLSTILNAQEITLDSTYVDFGVNKIEIVAGNDNQCLLSAVQADNKVILCGFTSISNVGSDYPFLSRYLEDGSLDPTFNNTGILIDSSAIEFIPFSMTLQADGKILIAGEKFYPNGPSMTGFVARYNSDGTIDSTFNNIGSVEITRAGSFYFGRSITIYNNDIFLAGYSNSNSPDNNFFCAKINETGTIDSTFGSNGIVDLDLGGNDVCRGISIQSDGKIILSGLEQDNFAPLLIRLNNDGSSDLPFNNNFSMNSTSLYGALYQTIVNPDNTINGIGFSFDTITGFVVCYIVELNSDGTLNTSFAANGEFFYNINQEDTYGIYATKHSNGKFVIVGNSGDASAFQMKTFAIGLEAEGNIDTSFVDNGIYIGEDNAQYDILNAVHLSSNNKIISTGYFEYGNEKYNPIITQFEIEEVIDNIKEIDELIGVSIYPNPASGGLLIISNQQTKDLKFNISNILGQEMSKTTNISSNQVLKYPIDLNIGMYLVNFYTNDGAHFFKKLIIQ